MIHQEKLINEIEDNYAAYFKDYKRINNLVAKSNAVYKGEPVPFLYIPKLFTERDIENFEKITDDIFKLINKSIHLYLTQKDVRKLFDFDPKLEELIKIEHDYKANVPMGRFDIFYYGTDDYKICELNTDGSSAMNEDKELGRIISDNLLLKNLKNRYEIESFELFDTWVKEVNNIANEFGITSNKPTVGIVDFIEGKPKPEFVEFKERFENAGFECVIIDPREFEYKNGYLYYQNQHIEIVYRRLVTKDLMERYDEIKPFIEGIKAKKTCVIGPIKSQIVHSKMFFKVLHESSFQKYLSKDEINYINKHIPFTKELTEIKKEYIQDKDNYIIKPVDNYASKGVYSGRDYSEELWKIKLEKYLNKNYLIQKYCSPALSKNVLFESDEEPTVKLFKNITGLFAYNEKFYGIYSREGLNPIISGLHECYTTPSFKISK